MAEMIGVGFVFLFHPFLASKNVPQVIPDLHLFFSSPFSQYNL